MAGQESTSIPDAWLVDWLADRELATTALLFLTGHRPLAFVTGQLLHVAAPAATLLGIDRCTTWATFLSDPAGAARLEQALHHAAQPDAGRHRQ